MATILIVDDKEINRSLLATILGSMHHSIIEAENGLHALKIAKDERPDLIITDIVMPKMDGYEFVYKLRNLPLLKIPKVIFYTAYDLEPEAIKLAKACGVNHWLTIPAEPQHVLQIINKVLNEEEDKDLPQEVKNLKNKHQHLFTKEAYRQTEKLTEFKNQASTLKELSIRDPLTGLFNRCYMEETLEREFDRANREHSPLALFMIDIDFFKKLNDPFGHTEGDKVLRLVAQCLQFNIRKGDIACRYGGEEFVVILLNTSANVAKARAEELRKEIENLSSKYKKLIPTKVTVSIGVACYPQHRKTSESIINSADKSLYCAKQQGRSQVVLIRERSHD